MLKDKCRWKKNERCIDAREENRINKYSSKYAPDINRLKKQAVFDTRGGLGR